MIGTEDLNIIGIDVYGNEVQLFVNGNFEDDDVQKFVLNRKERYKWIQKN